MVLRFITIILSTFTFISFGLANEQSIFDFDFYSQRCQKQNEEMRACIESKFDAANPQRSVELNRLEQTKQKLFDYNYRNTKLDTLVDAARARYIKNLSFRLRHNKILAHSFGKGEELWSSIESDVLKQCSHNPALANMVGAVFTNSSKNLGEFPSKEEKQKAADLYVKKIRLALFEIERLDSLSEQYNRTLNNRRSLARHNTDKIHASLERVTKRKKKILDYYPVLSQLIKGKEFYQFSELIHSRFMNANKLDPVDFIRSTHFASPTIDKILFDDGTIETEDFYSLSESKPRYQNFKLRHDQLAFEFNNDDWLNKTTKEQINASLVDTTKAIGELCSAGPCQLISLNPYYVNEMINTLTSSKERENLLNTICYCELRKEEKKIANWKYLVLGGAILGTGVACVMTAPVCLTGIALTGVGLSASWNDYQEAQVNKQTVQELAEFRSRGIVSPKLQSQTLDELKEKEMIAAMATLGVAVDLIPGMKGVKTSAQATKALMRGGVSLFDDALKGGASAGVKALSFGIDRAPAARRLVQSFDGGEQGMYTYMDLRRTIYQDDLSVKVENAANKYWDFVGDVYKKELDLSEAEVDGFIKSSREMSDRTLVITNTAKNTDNDLDFQGGVAAVFSGKQSDLLPLEKSTGVRVPRGPPDEKVAEIVRFTAKDANNKGLSRELLEMLAAAFSKEGGLDKVYVFTSRKHMVLYRRLRIKHRLLTEEDVGIVEAGKWDQQRDVIMEFSKDDYIKALLGQ